MRKLLNYFWIGFFLCLLVAGASNDTVSHGILFGFSGVTTTTDILELIPGNLQPGSITQSVVKTNASAISQYQIGANGVSGGPAQGPYIETWAPIHATQEGSSAVPFHSAVGAAEWANPSFDLYDGNFNSHDEWWNAAGGYENICVIGANDSGSLLNNPHFYGITSVDFYADGSTNPITATSAVGFPHQHTITGGSNAGAAIANVTTAISNTLGSLTINPTFPFAPGERIHISGATGSSAAYNGDWTIAPPDPNGVYGQKVGTLTLSLTNGVNTIPAGTPPPVGATVVSTEPLYWCAHVYPRDYHDGFHQARAVVHYYNGWTSVLETAKHVDFLDTNDDEGIVKLRGGFGYVAMLGSVSFLPQTNFGASDTTDCIVPGVGYTPEAPPSGGNPYWGTVGPAYHWWGDDQIQFQGGGFTATSGTISSNGSITTFQVPHTIATNSAPTLTEGSSINTAFTIPVVYSDSSNITPRGTTFSIASITPAITVNNGDQVTLGNLAFTVPTSGITWSGTTEKVTFTNITFTIQVGTLVSITATTQGDSAATISNAAITSSGPGYIYVTNSSLSGTGTSNGTMTTALTNPTYSINNIVVSNGVAVVTLTGTGASDVLAPISQTPITIASISWPKVSQVETINFTTGVTLPIGTTVTISGATLATGTGNPNIVGGVVTSSQGGQIVLSNPAVISGNGGTATGGTSTTTAIGSEPVNVTVTGNTVSATAVAVIGASAGTVSFKTAAATGAYTGGTLSITTGGYNQRMNTTTNSSGSVTVQFPDGESFSQAPTGAVSILWAQDEQYKISSFSFKSTDTFGANESITVAAPGGHNVNFVPGQIVYLAGLPNISWNSPMRSAQYQQPLTGNPTGGTMGVFTTVVAAPSANTFTFFGTSIGTYLGYSISSVSTSTVGGTTTETVNFTVPGLTVQPTIPIGSHITVWQSKISYSSAAFTPQLDTTSSAVTASSPGQVQFTTTDGRSGTAAWGILEILDGTYADSSSGPINVSAAGPALKVTSNLSVSWVQANNAAVGTPDYPHPGVQVSSMVLSAPRFAGTATVQYPSNIITPTGMTITGTGSVKLVSFQHSITNLNSDGTPDGPCTDSNLIISSLTDGISSPLPYGGGAGGSKLIQQWQSLWFSTNNNTKMYTPTIVVDNHETAGNANPNHYNITNVVDNGNGTATATFNGNTAVPLGSPIMIEDTVSADPNVDGFNTLFYGPKAVTNATFTANSGVVGCAGSPAITLTYTGTVDVFPPNSWLKIEGLLNTVTQAGYSTAWNGEYAMCAHSVGSVTYNVLPSPAGTPAWNSSSAAVVVPTSGIYPVPVLASAAGSPDSSHSTVTYPLTTTTNVRTAASSSYLSGGTIDVADCGQDGTDINACSTVDGALFSLHRTGQKGYLGSNIGIGFPYTLTSGSGFTNAETFTTTYGVTGTWVINGDGTCNIKVLNYGASFLPYGSQVDATLNTSVGTVSLTNTFIQASINVAVNEGQITIPCSSIGSVTPASGGTILWHSEFRVGMPLFFAPNSNYDTNNISLGIYPDQPYFVEAASGPGTTAGTLIAPGAPFLLTSIPDGPPLTNTVTGTLDAMQQEEDFSNVCLTGPSTGGRTPSAAQYYTLGNASYGNVSYAANLGWEQITSCSGSNIHAVVGLPSGIWGPGTSFIKISSLDMCAHTSLNSLPYCYNSVIDGNVSVNDATVYGNDSISDGTANAKFATWFDNIKLYGYSGYLAAGGPVLQPTNVGTAAYVTHLEVANNFYPYPQNDSGGYTGSAVEDLEFVNQTGQLSNWSLYDHVFFDGMPGAGYLNAIACGNSGWTAGGFPAIAGCWNPTHAQGTGVWAGGIGSGVRADTGCLSDYGTCNPDNTMQGNILTLGTITGGSGGTNGTYSAVALTGGSGTHATATIVVSGGAVTSVTIVNEGQNYVAGDTLSSSSIGGVSGFSVPVASITIGCNSSASGTSYGCNIIPMAQMQRDVQTLNENIGTSTVPAAWTQSNGGPFLDNSTYGMAFAVRAGANPVSNGWLIGSGISGGEGLVTSGTNIGKLFVYSSTTIDICAENRQCMTACFDATLANPNCPAGQPDFITAGCEVDSSPGVVDKAHSTSCGQYNTLNTTTAANVVNKVRLLCSTLGTGGPSVCNGTTNPNDTWEEVNLQTTSGALQSSIDVWNGAHLDAIFNKINSASWEDELFNEIILPLADPSCRVNAYQLYPILCNQAVGIAFDELSYLGPVAFLNSAGWDARAGGPGFGNDNKYFKNNQMEQEGGTGVGLWPDPLETSLLTVDTIYPVPPSGRLWDNSTCWTGPSGQTDGGQIYGIGGFGHQFPENGYAYNETLPTTNITVSGTVATLTFAGIPWTPTIPPGSLVHIKGLTGGLANANTDANPSSVNGYGNYFTLTTGSTPTPGQIQFTVPTGMNGLSQTSGITLDWPDGLFFNSPALQTSYTITSISWATTGIETVNYTSWDNLPIQGGSTVVIAGATTSNLNITGLAGGSVGSFTIFNQSLVNTSGSETETGATATFSQACGW